MQTLRALGIAGLFGALTCSACGGGNKGGGSFVTSTARFATTAKDKVDVLFVVDNSPSMKPKQTALRDRLGSFFATIIDGAAHPVSYHIGVITSDLGANDFVDAVKQCQPGGDQYGGGRLQTRGESAETTCLEVTGGKHYIDFDQHPGASNNLPPTQDLQTTLACMMSVGDQGCGFEQTLEATHRALTDTNIAENAGFLRDDALLAVVFLTDEDDCSAPSTADLYNAMPSEAPPAGLGALNSFRCVRFGVVCTDPATGAEALVPYGKASSLTGCRPATQVEGSKLYDVDRYTKLFAKAKVEGGIKTNPSDVMLFGIVGSPNETTEIVLGSPSNSDSNGQPAPCPAGAEPGTQNCLTLEQHACVAPNDQRFFADPAFRMRAVLDAAPNHRVHSICDEDYTPLVSSVTGAILAKAAGVDCLPFDPATAGDCSVALDTTSIAKCDATAANKPCWRTATDTRCNPDAQNATLVVERTDAAPAGEYVITCKKAVAE